MKTFLSQKLREAVMTKIYQWIIRRYRYKLESKIDFENFDMDLSRKIDALAVLLDE